MDDIGLRGMGHAHVYPDLMSSRVVSLVALGRALHQGSPSFVVSVLLVG